MRSSIMNGVTLNEKKLARQQKLNFALADSIARASGYKDHADAIAHRDPITGLIPVLTLHNTEMRIS